MRDNLKRIQIIPHLFFEIMNDQKKQIDAIPEEFESYEQAAEFWETHDTTNYIDEFETIEAEDKLRPEYDFSKMQIVKRGKGRKQPKEITVTLAPDVAKKFPTSEAVNEALRLIIKIADRKTKLKR